MQFINTTPHTVNLNDGRSFLATPIDVRVEQEFGDIVGDVAPSTFGKVVGLPPQEDGVIFIVSLVTLLTLKGLRTDCVAPATGHPDTIRTNDEKKHVISVPCFITL